MQPANLLKAVIAALIIVAILGVGWLGVATRTTWKGWLIPSKDEAAPKEAAPNSPERIELSEQAQKNLRLIVKEIALTTYWRRITLPGTVVDRPGHSDRGIPAPIAGVVVQVNAVPGKTIHIGDELFRIRIASESFQTSQMELFKSTRELEIAQKEYKRLRSFEEAVPRSKLLELEYQQDRLKVLIHAYKQDLRTRQLTDKEIKQVENGDFITEVKILMPERFAKHHGSLEEHSNVKDSNVEYGVQELKVNLGDYVQAGQILAYIADHRFLYIEGRALKQEASLLVHAAKNKLPVEAEFNSGDSETPTERLSGDLRLEFLGAAGLPLPIFVPMRIEFLGNTMDATGLTLPVYVPFRNPSFDYERKGQTHHAGMYRPGQKVLLKVAVAKLTGVFVLPVAAVAREGPNAYVFKRDGESFLRRAVNIVAEDVDEIAIANDGSILEEQWIAQNAAAALNRVLKASQADGGGGHHHD